MAGKRAVGSRESVVGGRASIVGGAELARPGGGRKPASSGQSEARKKSPLELDRLIHERLRLGIISALAVNERLTFNDLKRLLQTTDGNLSVHARKLEEAKYVSCEKSFAGRMPRTEYKLTPAGRRALEKYLLHMESIIKAVRD
jgi:DNA-binding HxlR family transcriptional regulator